MSMQNEFYVGYLPQAPQRLSRFIKAIVSVILLFCFLGSLAFSVGQNPFAAAFFEFTDHRTFQGTVQLKPYPYILVHRPGLAGQGPRTSIYLLVSPFKFGAEPALEGFDGKQVTLQGKLIYRDNQTMIELLPGSVNILAGRGPGLARISPKKISGKVTLEGEIVDSKCYLGVMQPAARKVHRSCAIRCISGGTPPLFVVKGRRDQEYYFLLVSAKGEAVNQEVLDYVAKPLRISGHVEKRGNLSILKADPSSYRLIH